MMESHRAAILRDQLANGGVPFGEPGEEEVLEATALEIWGFVVDPVGEKLVPRNLRALVTRTDARRLSLVTCHSSLLF